MADDLSTQSWFPLDNAAKIFPAILSKRYSTVFRVSAILIDAIDVNLLNQALNNIMQRFPFFLVQLKKGFFWYYLQKIDKLPNIREEKISPCSKIGNYPDEKHLFRILIFKKRISLEFSHILTDGAGATMFFKSLLCEYFNLKGLISEIPEDIITKETTVDESEFEDSYVKYFNPSIPHPKKINSAFHIPDKIEEQGIYNIITGIIELTGIMEKCKEKNVSLTEYLISILFLSFQELINTLPERKRKHIKPTRILVPVDLRKIYPSKTMKNFFLTVSPEIDFRLGSYSFDEILKNVFHYMRVEVNSRYISQQIARNVKSEKNPFTKFFPLFLKDFFLKSSYSRLGDLLYTTSLSNMGLIKFPEEIEKNIDGINVIPPPNPTSKTNCSVVGFKEKLYISFGRVIKNARIEKYFFRNLVKLGIQVKILNN